MMSLDDFKDLAPPESTQIVAPDGQVRSIVMGMFAGDTVYVEEVQAVIRVGDELRRKLPNGEDEVFVVTDPQFFNEPEFGPHYQVRVRRAGVQPPNQGGSFTIHVSGNNARANVNSTDNSVNIVNDSLLDDVREAIEAGVADLDKRAAMLTSVADMKGAKEKPSLLKAYASLMSSAGDHITVLTPFLPALASMLAGS